MRIISKFHDYYDSAMGYGLDPGLVYRRECSLHKFEQWPFDPRIRTILAKRFWYDFKPIPCVIGFCGRMYPMWIPGPALPTADALVDQTKRELVIAHEDLLAELRRVARGFYRPEQEIRSYLSEVTPTVGTSIGFELFRQLEAPIFFAINEERGWPATQRTLVYTNPRLANFGFARYFDAFAAFQEIAMALGSEMAPEDRAPRTVGGDAIIAASKGFDEQSFRSAAPGNKKLNRKANRARKRG